MRKLLVAMLLLGAAPIATAKTLSTANLLALHGLAGFSALATTDAGKAALQANLTTTQEIQAGASPLPGLQKFPARQEQALRDATVTSSNARELADGLGSTLGDAYNSLTDYPASGACSYGGKEGGNAADSVKILIAYTVALTGADSQAAKYYFANRTLDGKTPLGAPENIIGGYGPPGTYGVYGSLPGVAPDADNNSRPFQTERQVTYRGTDYFGAPRANTEFLTRSAKPCLEQSPAFPSGHTTYGYTESLLLAFMIPERYGQMLTRGAEYGDGRIIIGAHYAMDVIGGRSLAFYDVAHLLAENPSYLRQSFQGAAPVADYAVALELARNDLRKVLAARCKNTIPVCAAADTGRFKDAEVDAAFAQSTLTYGLPAVYRERAGKLEDVAALAPEAGYLLTAAFPKLSLAQADDILTATESPGGGFLDNGSAFGVYSRLDLVKAASQAPR
jgi:hypothetical protein